MAEKKKLTPKPLSVANASHEAWKILEKMEETYNDLLEQVYAAGYQDGLKAKSKKSK